MTRAHLLTTTIGLLVILGQAAGARDRPAQDSREQMLPQGGEQLPEGEGRTLILQGCVQCHDLRNTVSQRKTLVGWRRTVSEMIWRGAPLTADEARTITNYLVSSFGSEKPKAAAAKAQDGEKSSPRFFRVSKASRTMRVN